jgi:hypothetical protein
MESLQSCGPLHHSAPAVLLQAFLKYAIDGQCPLSFPYPEDNVALMRTGLLRHIDRCGNIVSKLPRPYS